MSRRLTLRELLDATLERSRVVMLRNAHGTLELRGDDLAIRESADWLTIFHGAAPGGSESRSHLHLRRRNLTYAVVREPPERTPTLEIWPDRAAAAGGGRAPLSVMFPSFYDWANDKAPIPEHRRYFERWTAERGRAFDLASPEAL